MADTTFRLSASRTRDHEVTWVRVTLALAAGSTKADAQAIAAQLPKSLRVNATTLSGHDYDENGQFKSWSVGYVQFRAEFRANGVNGKANETGVQRYRSLRKHLARLGYEVAWAPERLQADCLFADEAELNDFLATQTA